jgi:hypothetical protein
MVLFQPPLPQGSVAPGCWNVQSPWRTKRRRYYGAEDVLSAIRESVGSGAVGLISAVEFAAKTQDGLADPPGENTGIEIHPYKWTLDKENYRDTIRQAKQRGLLVLVGEMGFEDDEGFARPGGLFYPERCEFRLVRCELGPS